MRISFFLLFLLLWGCEETYFSDPLSLALTIDDERIGKVMENPEFYEVQIKLSVVNRHEDSLKFYEFEYNVDDSTYFYPASTVKFPASIIALEKLQELDSINLDTPFFVEGDSTATTLRHEIRNIFAVSSNDTYNRLFEFLGKDRINRRLSELQLQPGRISHRLSTSDAYNLTTKELLFQIDDTVLVSMPSQINNPIEPLELKKIRKGKGYFSDGLLIEEPMDFSERNYLPVNTIHNMMKRIMFPDAFPSDMRFDLSEDHYSFLKETMAILPRDMGYDTEEYFDGFGKFFLYGDTKDPIPDHIKIFNKVGYAYGYLTDCAYIVDSQNQLEYILTAIIHVNKDGIYNDNVYEYDEIGIPFLAQLGREIHELLIIQSTYE